MSTAAESGAAILKLGSWSFSGIWDLELGISSSSRQRVRLLHKFVAAPLAVRLHHLLRGGFRGRCFVVLFAFALHAHEFRVGRKVIETLAFEISERLEVVLLHKPEQLVLHS